MGEQKLTRGPIDIRVDTLTFYRVLIRRDVKRCEVIEDEANQSLL